MSQDCVQSVPRAKFTLFGDKLLIRSKEWAQSTCVYRLCIVHTASANKDMEDMKIQWSIM